MPNGRTGQFRWDKAQLLACAEHLDNEKIIGQRFENLSVPNKDTGVSVADWNKEISECPETEIFVEEQHHDTYFVHCHEKHELWICVDNTSPLYPRLRSLHEQWHKANQSQNKTSDENIWNWLWNNSGYVFLVIIIIFLLFYN